MTTSPAQLIQALLANPRDLANVKRVTSPDVTYVSLAAAAQLRWWSGGRGR